MKDLMKLKSATQLTVVLVALLAAGCSRFSDGDCIFIASPHLDAPPEKGEYWKDDSGSHWYYVGGELRSEQHHDVVITGCGT